MIDFHCHLDLYPEPNLILDRVIKERTYVLAVTTTPKAWDGTCEIARNAPRVRVALGMHPQLVAERHDEIDLFCSLIPETRYVGEVGLDGSLEHRHSMIEQKKVFERILGSCAKAGGRILSVHSRGAAKAVLEALEGYPEAGIVVLHWFTGSTHDLRRAIDLGCWFSVGPAMLATRRGVQLVEMIPKNRVLTETDGPLASHAGKALVPSDVIRAVEILSSIWHTDLRSAQNQIMDNCRLVLEKCWQ